MPPAHTEDLAGTTPPLERWGGSTVTLRKCPSPRYGAADYAKTCTARGGDDESEGDDTGGAGEVQRSVMYLVEREADRLAKVARIVGARSSGKPRHTGLRLSEVLGTCAQEGDMEAELGGAPLWKRLVDAHATGLGATFLDSVHRLRRATHWTPTVCFWREALVVALRHAALGTVYALLACDVVRPLLQPERNACTTCEVDPTYACAMRCVVQLAVGGRYEVAVELGVRLHAATVLPRGCLSVAYVTSDVHHRGVELDLVQTTLLAIELQCRPSRHV